MPKEASAVGMSSLPPTPVPQSVAWCSTVLVPGHTCVGPMSSSTSCSATSAEQMMAVSVATARTICPRSSAASSSSEAPSLAWGPVGKSTSLWRNRVTPCIVSACTGCALAPGALVIAASSTTLTEGLPMKPTSSLPHRAENWLRAVTTGLQSSSFRSHLFSDSWMLPKRSLRPCFAASSVTAQTWVRNSSHTEASRALLTTT
mmetsp:Transcript_8363/g.21317  ORF Transcript_8363/g.21317 Transcript_8363/m.21317 type:complete len:203 (+) Transcript_8363:768-1376(+)